MVQLQKYYRTNSNQTNTSNPLPLLNQLFYENRSIFGQAVQQNSFKMFNTWARKSPQLMGFINVITSDILSDDINFTPLDKKSGRNKVLKAKKFFNANKGREVMEETLNDCFLNGVGYNWIGKLDQNTVKEFCTKTASQFYEQKEIETKAEEIYNMLVDGDAQIAKKMRYIPASTISIETDEYEIKKYIQTVGVNTKIFKKEEVIFIKFFPFDGKVYGYAPMESLLAQVYLLNLISKNYTSFFENGGHPDKVFVLPKEIAGSKNHAYLIETLQKYKKIENKHGNMVFTGDITIEDLQKVESNMEHRELSLYIISVLAMFYGIPVGRIPFLIGKAANNGDAGGLADSGYWRKVSVWQSKLEEHYNSALFEPYFGVDIKFGRGYKQDEVRETQVEMQKTQIVEQRLRLGLWTIEEAGLYLGIDPEVISEAQEQKKKRDEEEMKSGMLLQNNKANGSTMPEPDKQLKNSVKKTTQNNNQTNAGGKKVNP